MAPSSSWMTPVAATPRRSRSRAAESRSDALGRAGAVVDRIGAVLGRSAVFGVVLTVEGAQLGQDLLVPRRVRRGRRARTGALGPPLGAAAPEEKDLLGHPER